MPFVHQVRPRYAEVDLQGVVFNAHWLTYFDDALTRFFEHLGFDPKETFVSGDYDAMVVKATLEWSGSAGYDEPVDIEVVPVRIGNASYDVRFRARCGARAACEGVITYVSVKRGTKDSTPIPDALRARLEAEMRAAGL